MTRIKPGLSYLVLYRKGQTKVTCHRLHCFRFAITQPAYTVWLITTNDFRFQIRCIIKTKGWNIGFRNFSDSNLGILQVFENFMILKSFGFSISQLFQFEFRIFSDFWKLSHSGIFLISENFLICEFFKFRNFRVWEFFGFQNLSNSNLGILQISEHFLICE